MRSLILGQGGRVVTVCGKRDAIRLAYFRSDGKVVIILEYHDRYVHSVSQKFRVPKVMMLLGNRDRRPKYCNLNITKKSLYARDKATCQWCGKKLSMSDATIDHVFPLSRGGTNTWRNITLSCVRCNVEKGRLTGDEYEAKTGKQLLNRPHTPGREVLFQGLQSDEVFSRYLRKSS